MISNHVIGDFRENYFIISRLLHKLCGNFGLNQDKNIIYGVENEGSIAGVNISVFHPYSN